MELSTSTIIEQLIYSVCGKQVMLDFHLAEVYQVETKRLNEQVKRNSNRFPEAFMFQLTESKWEKLQSQITSAKRRTLPYVFTEQAVAAVSGVIKNEKADEVSVARAFVAMRNFLLNVASVFQRLDQVELKQHKTDEKLEQIFEAFSLLKNNYSHLTYPLR